MKGLIHEPVRSFSSTNDSPFEPDSVVFQGGFDFSVVPRLPLNKTPDQLLETYLSSYQDSDRDKKNQHILSAEDVEVEGK